MMNKSKSKNTCYTIIPCSGIGKSYGTIARWSAYELNDSIRPADTNLLCLARLVVADEESKQRLQENHIITIDGCPKKCASKNVTRNEGTVFLEYMVPKIYLKHRQLKFDTKNITNPGPNAKKLAQKIAEQVNNDINQYSKEKTSNEN